MKKVFLFLLSLNFLYSLSGQAAELESPPFLAVPGPSPSTPPFLHPSKAAEAPTTLASLELSWLKSPSQKTQFDLATVEGRLQSALHKTFPLTAATAAVETIGGGWVNHNFRVSTKNQTYFARVAGEATDILGIDRMEEWAIQEIAAENRLSPKTIAFLPTEGVLITEFCPGVELSPKYMTQAQILKKTARIMRRCHGISSDFPTRTDPFERIGQYYQEAVRRGIALPEDVHQVLKNLEKIRQTLAFDERWVPCHLDVHAGNLMYDGRRLWLVDWEFAAMSHPYFDLAILASTHSFNSRQMEQLLYFYQGRVSRRDFAELQLFRCVADLSWAFWGFLEDEVSQIDKNYQQFSKLRWKRFVQTTSSLSFRHWLSLARPSKAEQWRDPVAKAR